MSYMFVSGFSGCKDTTIIRIGNVSEHFSARIFQITREFDTLKSEKS